MGVLGVLRVCWRVLFDGVLRGWWVVVGRVGVCQCVLWCRVEVCWGVLRVSQCMCTHSGLKVAVPMRPFWMGDEWMNEWLSVLPPPTHTHTHTHTHTPHTHTHTHTQMDGYPDGWADDRWVVGWLDSHHTHTHTHTHTHINGWVHRWMDGRQGGLTDGLTTHTHTHTHTPSHTLVSGCQCVSVVSVWMRVQQRRCMVGTVGTRDGCRCRRTSVMGLFCVLALSLWLMAIW